MKLTEIAIEGNTPLQRVQMGPLDRGLNFIYGENGAGKTFLSSFLRGLLQSGATRGTAANGHATCSSRQGSYVLRAGSDAIQGVHMEPLQNSSASVTDVGQLAGQITPVLHDSIFNFSLRDSARQRLDLAQLLHDQFSVAIGPEAADPAPQNDYQPQVLRVQTELNQLHDSIDALNATRARIVGEIGTNQASQQNRLVELNQQVELVTHQLSQLNRTQLQSTPTMIDQEIHELQTKIDLAATRVVATTPAATATDGFKQLYQRLDEVDQQIERWRNVQSDIQNQRVRLKDEMLVWNEMTLESDDHPYHNAREILIGLEARVDQAEQTAGHWSGNTASQVDVTQMAKAVEDLCQQMRDDLYSLCAELSSQYKHIRQRAAAVELKQLRRCYHEMGENTARLVQRRQHVIDEIRVVDPAGADAILRSEQAFCQCAAHEGYLEARNRYIGEVRPAAPVVTQVAPDLSIERARLSQLHLERNDVINRLSRAESDYAELDRQLTSLIQQRDSLSFVDVSSLEEQLRRIDDELRSSQTADLSLQRQLAELTAQPIVQASPVLIHAGQLLSQMTQGTMTQVFVSHHNGHDNHTQHRYDLQIRDSLGRVHNFTGVEPTVQDHVYLSLALAMVSNLQSSGIQLPMTIDDSFVHIGPDHVTATLTTLNEFSRTHEQQILLLSQHRYLADRLPGLPVFELPPTAPAATPYSPPLRSTPVPNPNEQYSVRSLAASYPIEPNPSLTTIPRDNSNRPYPLSKYSVDPAALAENVDDDRDFRLPWSPLNRSAARSEVSSQVRATTPQAFARDQVQPSIVTIDTILLNATGLFTLQQLGEFQDFGITTVEQLLDLDTEQLSPAFRNSTLTSAQIETVQSQALLLWSIPGLTADEARLLVAIGINDPEIMAGLEANQLLSRVQQFFASTDGQRFQQTNSNSRLWSSLNSDRVGEWHRSLSGNRSRWSSRSRRSRSSRSGSSRMRSSSDGSRESRSRDRSSETYRVGNYPQRQRMDHRNFDRSDRSERSSRPAALRPIEQNSTPSRTTAESTVAKSDDVKLKFYLDLNDDLEAAPSIGPKTAERFEKIGIITVADFLRQTAESMANRLDYKRLSAEVLRTWQQQTRLVCRIPNLRGHDAQLLVACDVTEPDELANMNPGTLFSVIGPFSDTKDGLKIIRSGKKPDLDEVTDWINWAKHTRSLQAA